jgi:hypothetical protein
VSTTIVPVSARCASANRSSLEPRSSSGSVISLGKSISIAAADVKVQQHDIKSTIAMYRFSPDIKDRESDSSWLFLPRARCC